jgi:hypothetical protein
MGRISSKSRFLARVLESRYWKESEARAVLAAWARTGESAAVFAGHYGLAPSRLLRWKARLSLSGREPVFHPVKLIEAGVGLRSGMAEAEATGTLELVLGGGRRILVRRGFDPEALAELVRAVESWEC